MILRVNAFRFLEEIKIYNQSNKNVSQIISTKQHHEFPKQETNNQALTKAAAHKETAIDKRYEQSRAGAIQREVHLQRTPRRMSSSRLPTQHSLIQEVHHSSLPRIILFSQ